MSTLLKYDKLRNIRDLGGMRSSDGRRIKIGKLFFRLNLPDPCCRSPLARTSASTSVMGIMASVRVSLTVTALSRVSEPRFHMLSHVEAAAVTAIMVKDTAMPVDPPKPKVFTADRPFSFYIYTTCNDVTSVMFAGEIVE